MFLIVEAPIMLAVDLAAQVIFALIPVIQVWRRATFVAARAMPHHLYRCSTSEKDAAPLMATVRALDLNIEF